MIAKTTKRLISFIFFFQFFTIPENIPSWQAAQSDCEQVLRHQINCQSVHLFSESIVKQRKLTEHGHRELKISVPFSCTGLL